MSQQALSPTQSPADPGWALQQAALLHNQGHLWEAEQLLDRLLKEDDRHFGALYHLGLIRLQQGNFADAALLLRRAVKVNKHSAEAQHQLAIALTGLERFEAAVSRYEKALALNPKSAEVHNNLGYALERLGRTQEAVSHYEQALALLPAYAEARNNLGNALQLLRRHEEAIGQYQQALALRPNYAEAFNNLGNALAKLGRQEEALPCYEKAIALRPNYPVFPVSLGNALAALDRHDEAVTKYERALAIDPENADAHACLAGALFTLGRLEDSLAHCEKALTIQPDHAAAQSQYGAALRALGRLDEATQAFEKAIEAAPGRAATYFSLASSRRFTARDRHFLAMTELARDMGRLDLEDQVYLHFALGKALADFGEKRQSFRHFIAGNSIKRQHIAYNEADTLARLDRVRATFSAELLRGKAGLGEPSRVPVFIVGMPRSGTTLVEQILASHPSVFGAGELRAMGKLSLGIRNADGTEWPESITSVSGEQLKELGQSYLQSVRQLAPNAERITDKMPGNFIYAGLIHLILPNARIIHTRRDPSDTALSCFSLLFADGQYFSYDLAELGRYYAAAYEKLMQHWRRVLPEGVMLEVQYEEVVADLEAQARRIVAHCGLEWNEACLSFHKTERPVRTASATQVRQPIYRSSVGRRQGYEDVIQPFVEALEQARAAAK